MIQLMSGLIDSFNRDGFLVVRDAIPGAVLDAFVGVLEAEVDRRARAMFKGGEISDPYAGEPFATRWYRMWQERGGEPKPPTWHACVFGPELYALWTHEAILDVVELVVGPEVQASGDYILRPKLPALNLLPWHQDSGYMPATEQYPWPTVWVPFVPVSVDNGAMQFIPGSHRQPIQEHRKSDGERYATPARDPAARRAVVTPELNPGDFVIFSNLRVPSVDRRPGPVGALVDRLPVQSRRHAGGRRPLVSRHAARGTQRQRSGPDTELGRSSGAVGAESSADQESIVEAGCLRSSLART